MSQQIVIQAVLIVSLLFIAVGLTRSTASARHQAVRRIMLVGFVVFAVTAVLFPETLTRIARLVGVGRGADLLLYALVIAFLGALASTFKKTSQLEDRITQLSREVALLRVEEPAGDVPRPDAASGPDAGAEDD